MYNLERDKELLDSLCEKHQVESELIFELLEIERDVRHYDRRHRIYERLRQCVISNLKEKKRKSL
ncbi:DNA modification system-associated small protein [Solibacillus sp. CAU 1738]|uniref:DNA modification system-associated small protein n=1 Tax=Solibacillus sp. CAU 1738 TaxID=3140363 RepID=UPI0032600B8A